LLLYQLHLKWLQPGPLALMMPRSPVSVSLQAYPPPSVQLAVDDAELHLQLHHDDVLAHHHQLHLDLNCCVPQPVDWLQGAALVVGLVGSEDYEVQLKCQQQRAVEVLEAIQTKPCPVLA
jgi:hypothetical protein